MKISLACFLLPALAVLAGCAQHPAATRNRTARVSPYATRRIITGSNVPQPVDRPTFSPTSADIPVGSFSRDPDSLAPTEPVVGAGGRSLYRLDEPSNGVSPAGSTPSSSRN